MLVNTYDERGLIDAKVYSIIYNSEFRYPYSNNKTKIYFVDIDTEEGSVGFKYYNKRKAWNRAVKLADKFNVEIMSDSLKILRSRNK